MGQKEKDDYKEKKRQERIIYKRGLIYKRTCVQDLVEMRAGRGRVVYIYNYLLSPTSKGRESEDEKKI